MSTQTVSLNTPRVFIPLTKPARYKGAWGGRGSGKSWFFASEVVLAASGSGKRILCAREVQRTLKDSSKFLIESSIEALGLGGHFIVKRDEIVARRGGGSILFTGLQDHTAESIKSLEAIDIVWIDEAHVISDCSWELLRPTIRKPGSEIWCSWNPRRPQDAIDRHFRGDNKHPSLVCVEANYSDNPWFPEELEVERKHDEQTKPNRYAHIWRGAYEPIDSDSIWRWDDICNHRRHEPPRMGKIVIGVDHAVSNGPKSDTHGIVVVGRGEDGRGYVLADVSTKGTPSEWSKQAVAAFDLYQADNIIIERNNGGDLVAQTLRTQRPHLPIIEVTATRGKHVRAEPIASLYSLGRVSHIGTFPELEAQMVQMTTNGFSGEGSPDRCDALVWALSHLFPSLIRVNAKRQTKEWSPSGDQAWMS